MSIYAQFDENGDQVQIATNRGWSEFIDWVESMDAETQPALSQLTEHGFTEEIGALIPELAKAMKTEPPGEDVSTIAKYLLRALRKNAEAEIVLITNGVTADDGDDDEPSAPPAI